MFANVPKGSLKVGDVVALELFKSGDKSRLPLTVVQCTRVLAVNEVKWADDMEEVEF